MYYQQVPMQLFKQKKFFMGWLTVNSIRKVASMRQISVSIGSWSSLYIRKWKYYSERLVRFMIIQECAQTFSYTAFSQIAASKNRL